MKISSRKQWSRECLASSKKIRSHSKNPGFNSRRELCVIEERTVSNGTGAIRLYCIKEWRAHKDMEAQRLLFDDQDGEKSEHETVPKGRFPSRTVTCLRIYSICKLKCYPITVS